VDCALENREVSPYLFNVEYFGFEQSSENL